MPRSAAKVRTKYWVSKTDLTRYVRCPYAFWLLDRGKITFEDTIDEFQADLLLSGSEFQGMVEAAAVPMAIEPDELPGLLTTTDVKVLGVPTFENAKLWIRGRPDGIDAAHGALIPIEIKSHKGVQPIDELELAFYWMLLEPQRTRHDVEPRGILMLRRDGEAEEVEEVEVAIKPQRVEELRRLLKEIRRARRYGVRPRICGCIVCRSVKREDVLAATQRSKDLTLIFGVGRHYARALEDMGIATFEGLLTCDAAEVVDRLRDRSYYVSEAEVGHWRRHAQTWATGEPVYFGARPCVGDSFIALDLEYDGVGMIWLVGICVVSGQDREYSLLWADDEVEERANLRRLAKIVTTNPTLPVITWSGESADIPRLRSAAKRLRLRVLGPLFERHRDIYAYARSSVRLPIPSLSLKEVAAYFGIAKVSQVHDGLEAKFMYIRYRNAKNEKDRVALHEQLMDYSRDDLDALIGAAMQLRAMAA